MTAILSNTIENAGRLSDSLQRYWNTQGVYKTISIFETEAEFMESMQSQLYSSVILERLKNPLPLIPKIRSICPDCKIGVVTDNPDRTADNEVALACAKLNVETMITMSDFERPLFTLSKKLNLV